MGLARRGRAVRGLLGRVPEAGRGFIRLDWSLATIEAMTVSFYCMSQALRSLPMGTVYAVWTGIGAAGGLA